MKFICDTEHNLMIKKIYNQPVCDHLTSWIRPSTKKELEAHSRNDERFKHCHPTSIANRTLPRSLKYTGGSTTFMKTKSRLVTTLVENFKYTHTLNTNKDKFADERSAAHYEEYTQRLEAATQQSQPLSGNNEASSETSVVDPKRVWHETTSEPHKNRHFGLGLFFTNGLRSSVLVASSASVSATSPTDPQEIVDLREEVQKLTQELHQQVK
ncbi:hypothetical protein Ahy_B06g081836 [Arachis hypogaea]|uniref:Uncharacterized protein n=1 Tax=Arachis hypogaea TaxID=3818 RepID=A0A444YM78_ARAHY|nr:hypothetical protein Ahy_B06g081836 [Arachis hypogaea]